MWTSAPWSDPPAWTRTELQPLSTWNTGFYLSVMLGLTSMDGFRHTEFEPDYEARINPRGPGDIVLAERPTQGDAAQQPGEMYP